MARLRQAPVCFTLAQMRFNPHLEMAPILPGLQDAFRKAGYPDYESARVAGLQFQQDADGFSFNQKSVERHIFRNKGRTAAILLDTAALTFELTDYPVFEEFSKSFLHALEIVNGYRPIEYWDRLGMRMLDAVQPTAGESVEEYVLPQALGFVGLIGEEAEHQHTLTESVYKIGSRTLVLRTMRVPRGILAPPDLAPIRLKIASRFEEHQGETVMLDTDCFQDERSEFSIEAAGADLRDLKSALSRSFKVVVTPHALNIWSRADAGSS